MECGSQRMECKLIRRKLEALQVVVAPSNVSELKSFLGMVNFSSRFIAYYSDKTEKLRALMKKDVIWRWTSEHQRSFEDLKKSLVESTVLGCHDVKAAIKLIVDASPTGLEANLVQKHSADDDKVIAYASRPLTAAERRYSQIERECLAMHFGSTRFQMYLLEKQFSLFTDHQPLLMCH